MWSTAVVLRPTTELTRFKVVLAITEKQSRGFRFSARVLQCGQILTASAPTPVVDTLIVRRPMKKLVVPELATLLDFSTVVDPMPFAKTWEQARMDPFVQVHTSGSTGTPKLQTLKHGNFCCIDAFQIVEPNDIATRQGNQRTFCPFPPCE